MPDRSPRADYLVNSAMRLRKEIIWVENGVGGGGGGGGGGWRWLVLVAVLLVLVVLVVLTVVVHVGGVWLG